MDSANCAPERKPECAVGNLWVQGRRSDPQNAALFSPIISKRAAYEDCRVARAGELQELFDSRFRFLSANSFGERAAGTDSKNFFVQAPTYFFSPSATQITLPPVCSQEVLLDSSLTSHTMWRITAPMAQPLRICRAFHCASILLYTSSFRECAAWRIKTLR